MGCDGVCNLTMGFDCFLMQCISCAFYKKRNRAVDHRDQPRYHNILTAQGNSSVKLNIFVCVILMIIQQHFYFIAESGDFFYVFFFCVRSCHSCYGRLQKETYLQKIMDQLLFISDKGKSQRILYHSRRRSDISAGTLTYGNNVS